MTGSRSLKKFIYVNSRLLNKYFLKGDRLPAEAPMYVVSRDSTILPEFIGKTAMIHNGKEFKETTLQPGSEGMKFGEFSFTRKICVFRKKEKVLGKKNFR
ncbi:ribosomal protein S19 [Acrasis kona]|uniref:Ribosomal protein S19 n=1 Tax=Acrasis kona TaxID=1008807 RepID=A0AAW2ZAT3_9EUKA